VALKLNQPQPSISASLRKLRELTGDPLLVRGARMVPTQHGESLLKPAKRILDETERLFVPKTAFVPQEEERTFHIAAPDYMNTPFFTEVIARLRRESPRSRIVIHAWGRIPITCACSRMENWTWSSPTGTNRLRICTCQSCSTIPSSA
jgi:DNA-binding transcriptional LysR family regulator